MLTRKQYDLLIYIQGYLDQKGLPPSFDEMRDALNLKSKSGIHRLVGALEERGFIRRLPHRARAVEIVRLPEDILPQNRKSSEHSDLSALERAVSLPLYGKIAAGTPIEAISDPSSFVAVPAHLVGAGEHYALTIDGDSMIEAGIMDGDTVILRRADRVENGGIAVALVRGEDATLKRIYQKGRKITLEPANAIYSAQHYPANEVTIQGRLVGLVRDYS